MLEHHPIGLDDSELSDTSIVILQSHTIILARIAVSSVLSLRQDCCRCTTHNTNINKYKIYIYNIQKLIKILINKL